MIVIALAIIYWYISPLLKPSENEFTQSPQSTQSILPSQAITTTREKVQYYVPLFLLGISAVIIFFAATQVSDKPICAEPTHHGHHLSSIPNSSMPSLIF